MKKSLCVLLAFILFIGLFNVISVNADVGESLDTTIGDLKDKKETIDDLKDEDKRSEYLKQEWGKILAKNKFSGPIVKIYNKIKPFIDPVFKYTIGLESSPTWLFVLALVIFITFIVYLYRTLSAFSTFSDTTSLVISFALSVAMGNFGFWKTIPEKIIDLIMIFTIWWVQLIIILAIIIGLSISNKFSLQFKKYMEKWKEKRDKEKAKQDRAEFAAAKDTAVKFSTGIVKALEKGEGKKKKGK